MTAITLRGMAERKLRSALTLIAIVLGVAMIAGTYVLTDQITNAFENIEQALAEGTDAVVKPKEDFSATVDSAATIPASVVERVRQVDGVAAADGDVFDYGQIVVDGEVVETFGAPGLVLGATIEPFDVTEVEAGRRPARTDEVMVIEGVAERQGITVGDRIGITTRTGVQDVTVVGIFGWGREGMAIGGTTAVVATKEDVERWFDRPDEVSAVNVAAAPGISEDELVARLRRAIPDQDLEIVSAERNAMANAKEINDTIGAFLTPALLAFAGAAVLVGAFIIFNTFSITVAQRTKEFALLRSLGATRRQVLGAVAAEALLLGVAASALGLAAGLGIAALLGAAFDAAGFGIPRSGLVLEPRTIAVAVGVGVGVTLLAAVGPALRATRVAPIAAMRDVLPTPSRRARRVSAGAAVLVTVVGVGFLVGGLFGGGTATGRLGLMAGGASLLFIGLALSARYLVRPLASALGWPLERAFRTPGRLARENAMRNPGRTAVTSAALMVGLGMVVFVAVFAAGLKSTFTDRIDTLMTADYFVYSDSFQPVPRAALEEITNVPGVATAEGMRFEQVEVDGKPSNVQTDVVLSFDPAHIGEVYDFEWVEGDASLVATIRREEALVEEQFAKRHGIEVGDAYTVRTPSGGEARLQAIGIYRDPILYQGQMVREDTLSAFSDVRDPFFVAVAADDAADAAQVQQGIAAVMQDYPSAKVESNAEYRDTVGTQLDQIVYLLYALLAMSVVISLFGIANSLFLSIHERTREFGLLRAIGATRRQVRQVVRYESVITSLIGGVLGVAVGLLFAWLITLSLDEWGLGFAIPVGQLAGFLALAVVVGVIGAVLPARRGARIDILDAVHHE